MTHGSCFNREANAKLAVYSLSRGYFVPVQLMRNVCQGNIFPCNCNQTCCITVYSLHMWVKIHIKHINNSSCQRIYPSKVCMWQNFLLLNTRRYVIQFQIFQLVLSNFVPMLAMLSIVGGFMAYLSIFRITTIVLNKVKSTHSCRVTHICVSNLT